MKKDRQSSQRRKEHIARKNKKILTNEKIFRLKKAKRVK